MSVVNLKPAMTHPWPHGHGPIEARRALVQCTGALSHPWPHGHGPIEAAFLEVGVHQGDPIHGLTAMAPLKLLVVRQDKAEELAHPWPHGHGPIEAVADAGIVGAV